jgi:pimeloyl-ACP methyl ester carboxylesterase
VAVGIDAVANESGRPVDLLGHSFGGICALAAAVLSPTVRRLVV